MYRSQLPDTSPRLRCRREWANPSTSGTRLELRQEQRLGKQYITKPIGTTTLSLATTSLVHMFLIAFRFSAIQRSLSTVASPQINKCIYCKVFQILFNTPRQILVDGNNIAIKS